MRNYGGRVMNCDNCFWKGTHQHGEMCYAKGIKWLTSAVKVEEGRFCECYQSLIKGNNYQTLKPLEFQYKY